MSQRLQVLFDQALESALRVSEPHVSSHFAETLRRLQPHVASVTLARGLSPRTLCHGDAHTANVFYPTSGDRSPEQLAVCDWQLMNVGRGVADIVRFQMLSMALDERRAAAPRLAEAYVSELEARGIAGYPLAAYERDFRLCTLFQAASMTIAFAAVDVSTDRGQELVSVLLPRIATALEDLGDISDVLDGLG